MPGATETLPESPASIMDGELPKLDAEDVETAAELLGLNAEEEAETEATEAQATEAEATAEETDETPEVTEQRKQQQQREQKLANREKSLLAAEKRMEETSTRLDKALARLEANPTAANKAEVEQATRQSVVAEAKAKIAAIKADPKFDRYTDGDKIDMIMFDALEKLETGQTALAAETAAAKQEQAARQQHENWWNSWTQKNAAIGRAKGEQLWAEADKQADAEMEALKNEGFPVTRVQAGLHVFRRLVAAERAKKPAAGTKPPGAALTGGRLAPAAGRAASAPGKQKSELDAIFDPNDIGKYNLLS